METKKEVSEKKVNMLGFTIAFGVVTILLCIFNIFENALMYKIALVTGIISVIFGLAFVASLINGGK